jgi:hypothetical protein
VFAKKLLIKLLKPKTDKGTGAQTKLNNDELHTFCSFTMIVNLYYMRTGDLKLPLLGYQPNFNSRV